MEASSFPEREAEGGGGLCGTGWISYMMTGPLQVAIALWPGKSSCTVSLLGSCLDIWQWGCDDQGSICHGDKGGRLLQGPAVLM